MLRSKNYAYAQQSNLVVTSVKEKDLSKEPMNEFASSGTYYFRTGKLALKYCSLLKMKKMQVNGEFYISLAFELMLRDNLSVIVYPVNTSSWEHLVT